jgi:hypothetical protein
MVATMDASPAAMAPLAAAALPPPGSRSGRGKLLDKRLDAGAQARRLPSLPPMIDASRFSRMSDVSKVLDLQEPLGSLLESLLGDEADDLAGHGTTP